MPSAMPLPVGGVVTIEHLDSQTVDPHESLEVADLSVDGAAPETHPEAFPETAVVPVSEPAEQAPSLPPDPPKPKIVSISTTPDAPSAQPGTKGGPGRGTLASSSPPIDPGFTKR